jgi:diguanylate cyclase (GGDEF)-like protein
MMEVILSRCIALDTAAQETYSRLAEVCSDPQLAEVFRRMSAEEWAHVEWWTELKDAYLAGRVPAPIDTSSLQIAVDETMQNMGSLLEVDFGTLSIDQMLELAVHMEFFMMDPAFGELFDLFDPSATHHHRSSYSRHVMRIVGEVEKRYTDKIMAAFLARILMRTFRDQERLSALATRDPLTGLYNRRGLYSHLVQWASWSERYEHALGVLIIDVDHFKQVNDSYGHPAGDQALVKVAAALQGAVRDSDLVGRYGGDEFAVLAPETTRAALEALAHRVLEGVRATALGPQFDGHKLTASVGAAFVQHGRGTTPEALLACADRSLYAAKSAGRDQVGDAVDAATSECEPQAG